MPKSDEWSDRFGLARTPLFEEGEVADPQNHTVLLDGGDGSFILSECSAYLPKRSAASWAWSAYLPHHVAVSDSEAVVTRWDRPDSSEVFSFRSVAEKLDSFYDYLIKSKAVGQDVVSTLLDLFRAVRGEVLASRLPDEVSIHAFLDVLAQLLGADSDQTVGHRVRDFRTVWADSREATENVPRIGEEALSRLEAGFKEQVLRGFGFEFRPSLAVRHAASAIFQEAHFTFEASSQLNFFAYQSSDTSRPVTRGTRHFTPPPLARTVVEQAFASLSGIERRTHLIICDPACGSGAFLTEALRTLRRLGFHGQLHLVGRDISAAAVAMARFSLEASRHDWAPEGGLQIEVSVSDSLVPGSLPTADIIVMNPPFIAWPMMDNTLRQRVREVLGSTARHRPDSSMAFITRALESVAPGGVVASLLPASVLSLDSAKSWRSHIIERSQVSLLGSFGQYGLFVHALVQVAALILVAGQSGGPTIGLQSADQSAATGEVFRALRRLNRPLIAGISGKGWRIINLEQSELAKQATWRILPERVARALRRLDELGMPRVTTLFDVKQGLLTGLNEVLIISSDTYQTYPEAEQRFFKPAVFRDALTNATLAKKYYVFFPYGKDGLLIKTEAEPEALVPSYVRQLRYRQHDLERRSGIDSGHPWWVLSRYYAWAQRSEPRILTKYFGGPGAFSVDANAEFIPVQGYAWFALPTLLSRVRLKSAERLLLRSRSGSGWKMKAA